MTLDDDLSTTKSGLSAVGELIKTAGNSPEAAEAATNLGKAAVTITKTINNALLPLAAVNFAFDKARDYFSSQFQKDLEQKASDIPQDKVVQPKASIAGPALQGLAFTHEEESLKEMYLNLLKTAMDGRVSEQAHPAFVEIIKQLSGEDAMLIKDVLQSATALPIVEIRSVKNGEQGWNLLHTHMVNFTDSKTGCAAENHQMTAIIDNWIRLGLVTVDYNKHLIDSVSYAWIENRPEVLRYKEVAQGKNSTLNFQNGILQRTALGEQFALAVGINPRNH